MPVFDGIRSKNLLNVDCSVLLSDSVDLLNVRPRGGIERPLYVDWPAHEQITENASKVADRLDGGGVSFVGNIWTHEVLRRTPDSRYTSRFSGPEGGSTAGASAPAGVAASVRRGALAAVPTSTPSCSWIRTKNSGVSSPAVISYT